MPPPRKTHASLRGRTAVRRQRGPDTWQGWGGPGSAAGAVSPGRGPAGLGLLRGWSWQGWVRTVPLGAVDPQRVTGNMQIAASNP